MEQPKPKPSTFWRRLDIQALQHALRTTAAATLSLIVARACRLPEAGWAVITTLIVTQSTLGLSWNISWQRLVGTAIGGVTAIVVMRFFSPGLVPFALSLLAIGLVAAFFPVERSAYRFAGTALAIIILPQQTSPIWVVALHRFLEISIGIVVAMAVTAVWPERAAPEADTPPPAAR